MKGSVASSCFPVLVLVLQASLCLASRPDGLASRSLLQTQRAAGVACELDDLCSNGDGTTTKCPCTDTASCTGMTCPIIPAGLPCKSKDICSSEQATLQACPSDPATSSGTCPLIPAGQQCKSKDRCATDATNSALCVVSRTSTTGLCPNLLSAVSCSGASLTGVCSGDEICSAKWPVQDLKSLVLTGGLLNDQDITRGNCGISKAAGSACTAGSDTCSGQGSNVANTFCSVSPCPLARPGQECSDVNPKDKCYDGGVTDGGKFCPTTSAASSTCPPLVADSPCKLGDVCVVNYACNAVGANDGKCVATKPAGASCTPYAAASGTSGQPGYTAAVPADICATTTVDPITFKGTPTVSTCTASPCPLVPAGQACRTGDLCSIGAAGGAACPTTSGAGVTAFICPTIVSAGACWLNDQCAVDNQFCNALGAQDSQKGTCVEAQPAGAACQPAVAAVAGGNGVSATSAAAGDYCAPTGTLCPSGKVCPVSPAGATCYPQLAAVTAGGNQRAARAADKCNTGVSDPSTAATVACPPVAAGQLTNNCPSLATGIKCDAGLDVCVRGAQCLNGVCQPNSKATASSAPAATTAAGKTASTGVSTAAKVPAVTLSPILNNYDVSNFTGSVPTQYCTTIQNNIMNAYNVVSNCSTRTPTPGSVVVPTTVAFNGDDSKAATAAQSSFSTDLKNKVTTVFGVAYGTVTVPATSVESTTVTNPAPGAASGAAIVGMAWTVGVAILVSALVMIV